MAAAAARSLRWVKGREPRPTPKENPTMSTPTPTGTHAPNGTPPDAPQTPYGTGPYGTDAPAATGTPLAVTSLILGLVSILAGWTFVAPVVGLVVGILALRREPRARTMALWGIALNAIMLAGVFLLLILGLAFGLAFLPFAFVF
jgi:hypothetical protein